jgi:hypothetical protein
MILGVGVDDSTCKRLRLIRESGYRTADRWTAALLSPNDVITAKTPEQELRHISQHVMNW